MLEDSGICLWLVAVTDTGPRTLFLSPAAGRLLGRPRESLVLDPGQAWEAVHPEDRGRVREGGQQLLRGRPVSGEVRLLTPAREVRWVQVEATPLSGDPPDRPLVAVWGTDITRLKQALRAGREAEARWRAMLSLPSLGVAILSATGEVVEANRAFTEMLDPGGVLAETCRRLFEALRQSPEDFHQVEKHYLRADHQTLWARVSLSLVREENGAPVAGLALVENLTGQRRTEEALRQSRERFRLLYDRAPLAYQTLDADGRFLDVNQTWLDLTGYSREEVLDRWFGTFLTPASVPVFEQVFFALKQGGEIAEEELTLACRDGRHLPVALTGKRMVDEAGRFQQALLLAADISRRREAEEALRRSELRYRTLVEQIPAITYTARADDFAAKLFVSPQAQAILGFSWSDYEQDPDLWRRQLHPEDRDRVLAEMARCQAEGAPFAAEYRMLTQDQRVVWLRDEARLITDTDGRPLAFQGVILDITARRQAESERETYHNLLTATFTAFQDLIVVLDRDLRVVMSNWRPGFPAPAPVPQEFCHQLFVHCQEPCRPCLVQEVFTQGTMQVREMTAPDGRILELRAFPVTDDQGQVTLVVKQVVDITARRRSEEALRRSEENYRLLVSSIPGVVFRGYADWRIEVFDDQVETLTGYPREDFTSGRRKWCDLIVPEDLPEARRLFVQALEGTLSYVRSYRIRHREGHLVWVQARGQIILDAQGRIDHVIGVCFDISAQKQIEEQLATEKERLAVTLRSIGDGVIATDTQGRIVLMNDVAERLTGWTQAEAKGVPAAQVFCLSEESNGGAVDPVLEVIRTGRPLRLPAQALLRPRDGAARSISATAAPIVDRSGQVDGVVLVFQDITGHRQLEAELRKIEKLSSLSILAGGIAHDFNNILTGILGNLSLAMIAHQDQDLLLPRLAEAERAALRARDLVQQLLTFAKGGAPVKEVAFLPELIRESANFTCRGSQARVAFDLAPDLKPAEVDPAQFSQVIQNLILNAVQAMPRGGTIWVTGENVRLGPDSPLPLPQGPYIKISVKDQGVGIPEAYLAKIFDPFFSTKQKGSGLGLATAYSIIKNHGGYMTVTSQVGQGTVFHIYLPASAREAPPPRPRAPAEPVPGRGRVLVMDDDEMVRSVAGKILAHLGYEADFARDGEEALRLYDAARHAGRPFDVVIMDLTIPGSLGGKETIRRLLHLAPEARVIVSSGYADDPIITNYQEYGFKGVIRKPYRIHTFSRELARVINLS
ncbi:MAG: PAS domain S-box protein [Syntrophobacterales bacterium]|nr:PAS domain S-box protein [Syntrophobacterales bacterium]